MASPKKPSRILKTEQAARPGKVSIAFALGDQVNQLGPYIAQILAAVKVKGAWISDRTCLTDFLPAGLYGHDKRNKPARSEWLNNIGDKLGLVIDPDRTSIVEIARQLKKVQSVELENGEHRDDPATHH
jgi:hypothetical protein